VEPSPTILVVDDVAPFASWSRSSGACGRVITARGREADVAARERPAVVVLDAHLPDVSGDEVPAPEGPRRWPPVVVTVELAR
jgi:CheY-like chemotaxis protein